MKTELDKCMAGEWYDCHDPIFITQKGKTRQLLARYNALPYEEKKTKQEVLKEMFGSIGNNVSVGTPFLCDYGCNIHIGDNVSVNMNCSFIDCNKITIGSHVLIASNVQIYTATHPIELSERLIPGWTPDQAAYFCRTYALTADDIAWLVPHQANLRIISATGDRMGLDPSKVMVNIQKYGNTTSATIPLCLYEWENQLHKGDNLILAAFGAGFTWLLLSII